MYIINTSDDCCCLQIRSNIEYPYKQVIASCLVSPRLVVMLHVEAPV